jgi:hypothetical protein
MRLVLPREFLDRLATDARQGKPTGDEVVPFARPTLAR